MKDTQRFQLIDGNFTPSEAGRVLLSLVQSKMDFHCVEKMSNEERFGRDRSRSERRLQELAKLQSALKELIEEAVSDGHNLRVRGWIEIASVK
jgi:hypothetical protein